MGSELHRQEVRHAAGLSLRFNDKKKKHTSRVIHSMWKQSDTKSLESKSERFVFFFTAKPKTKPAPDSTPVIRPHPAIKKTKQNTRVRT